MIDRSNYTSEMWEKKSEMDLRLNALFLKRAFREYVTSKVSFCPSDLNFDTVFEDDGAMSLLCCQKHYGYDSSSNKGQQGSDLGDYDTECFADNEIGAKYWPLLCYYIRENDADLCSTLDELDCKIYW